MTPHPPAPSTTARARRIAGAGLLVVVAVAVGVLGHEATASSSAPGASPRSPSTITSSTGVPHGASRQALGEPDASRPPDPTVGENPTVLGEADGALPSHTTVFDNRVPGVAKLDPALLVALRRAATDAAGYGVELRVDSGWRSPAYQEQLLQQAISKYGSKERAARWVATPRTSAHVSGDAVDIGPFHATAWLAEHGAAYGLCQIYRNEPWHYELRPGADEHGCPPPYADPTHDPRMQQ